MYDEANKELKEKETPILEVTDEGPAENKKIVVKVNLNLCYFAAFANLKRGALALFYVMRRHRALHGLAGP